jgi:hypothetical protein
MCKTTWVDRYVCTPRREVSTGAEIVSLNRSTDRGISLCLVFMRLCRVYTYIGGCLCPLPSSFCPSSLYLLLYPGDDLRENFSAGHVCWDSADVLNGRPTGAVRASIGALTTFQEVYLLVRFIKHYFLGQSVVDVVTAMTGGRQEEASVHVGVIECAELQALPVEAKGGAAEAKAADLELMKQDQDQEEKELQKDDDRTSHGNIISDWDVVQHGHGEFSVTRRRHLGSRPLEDVTSKSTTATEGVLTQMFLYPVKSCAPQEVCAKSFMCL